MRKNATTTNGFFALGLAALLTTSLQATAATLIPAEYTLSTDAETRQENFPFTITYDFTLSNEFVEVQEVSSAETFGGVPPLAIAQADVNASNLSENNTIRPDTRAIANIFYQFGVVGTPSGSDFLYQVPVRVQAQGQADTSTDPFDTASAIAAVTIGGLQWGGVTANSSNPLDNFSFDRIFTVTCNTTAGCPSTNVFVQTQATAGLMLDIGQSGSSAANAFADPIITIDPNFVDAALFDIVFSPGLDVVPIPASVYLFGSGLLGLVGMARRKKAA